MLLEWINQGKTLGQLAREYGISYEAVRHVLRAAGKEIPGKRLSFPCLSLRMLDRDESNHSLALLTICACLVPVHGA